MPAESATAFLELLKSDPELARRLAGAGSEDEAWEIIKAAGDFNFSHAEWFEALKTAHGHELSDDELDQVAGGADVNRFITRSIKFITAYYDFVGGQIE